MAASTQGHLDRQRAESFGTVAERYDQARPSYPSALIDDLAALGPRHVLDVGCGTGIVTRLLAGRGVDVLGIEIDARMAEVARAHGSHVEVGSFETWDDAGRRFELITCGQAWHWIDPQAGAEKAARLLRPSGGTLALFWNYLELDATAQRAVDAVYTELAPQIIDSAAIRGGGPRVTANHRAALETGGQFPAVVERTYPWDHVYTRATWLAMLATHSDHLALPGEQLTSVLEAMGRAVDALGGTITAHYTTYGLLARAAG